MEQVNIELFSKPISVNKLYTGRRRLTKDGARAKRDISLEIKMHWKKEPVQDEVTLNVIFYMQNKRTDIDNLLKGLLDCMTGIVYQDDRQITELHVYKEVDKSNPRTIIQIL